MTQTYEKEVKHRKKQIILISIVLLICAVIYIVISFAGVKIPCVFNRITGLKCPGCGNTRAVKALLRMDIRSAFAHNLLFPLELGYIAWVYLKTCHNYIKNNSFSYRTPHPALDIIVLVIILLWGIVRNIFNFTA